MTEGSNPVRSTRKMCECEFFQIHEDSMTEGSNPVRSARKMYEFFPSQKCCADSLSVRPTPSVVYTHAYK